MPECVPSDRRKWKTTSDTCSLDGNRSRFITSCFYNGSNAGFSFLVCMFYAHVTTRGRHCLNIAFLPKCFFECGPNSFSHNFRKFNHICEQTRFKSWRRLEVCCFSQMVSKVDNSASPALVKPYLDECVFCPSYTTALCNFLMHILNNQCRLTKMIMFSQFLRRINSMQVQIKPLGITRLKQPATVW